MPAMAATTTRSDPIPVDAGAVVTQRTMKMTTTAPVAASAGVHGTRFSTVDVRAEAVPGWVDVETDQERCECDRGDDCEIGQLHRGGSQSDRGHGGERHSRRRPRPVAGGAPTSTAAAAGPDRCTAQPPP